MNVFYMGVSQPNYQGTVNHTDLKDHTGFPGSGWGLDEHGKTSRCGTLYRIKTLLLAVPERKVEHIGQERATFANHKIQRS